MFRFPMHPATCRSFERAAGSSSHCLSFLPWPGRAVQPSPLSFISDIVWVTGQWLCLLKSLSQPQVVWRLDRSQLLSCSLKKRPLFLHCKIMVGSAPCCWFASAVGRLCRQPDPLDSVLSPRLRHRTRRQVQLHALPEGQKALPAKVKAGLCPYLCSPCRRGSSSLRGSTGVEVGPRPAMVTPQIIPGQPPATARWREVAAGQEPKKVQNQARGPSWEASVQLWFCAREITALICLWGQNACICILHLQALHFAQKLYLDLSIPYTEFGHKPMQKTTFTIGIVWLSYLLFFFLWLSPNCSKDAPLPYPPFSKRKTRSEMDCACFSLFQCKILSSSQLPSATKKHLQNFGGKIRHMR